MAPVPHVKFWPLDPAETYRFMQYVDPRGPDECWPWTANRNQGGYGLLGIKRDGRNTNALSHRLAWSIENKAEPPDGMLVLHSCDNPRCCNPMHLRLGTHQDNSDDAVERKRTLRRRARERGTAHPASKYTDEQKQQAIELYRQRKTMLEIARALGCHRTSVSRWIEEHHLETGWRTEMSETMKRTRPGLSPAKPDNSVT